MGMFDPTDISWNGKEIQSLAEAIIEKPWQTPALNLFHDVKTDIKAKQQIAFLGRIALLGRKREGSCDVTASSETIAATEKFWDPVIVADKFVECWDNLRESFFIWGTKNGIDRDDLDGTDFANFLEDLMVEAMERAIFNQGWFGDTAAGNYNSSPAGNFTNGTSLAYFNAIDGIWKQLFTIGSNNAARLTAISKNSGSSYSAQSFDPAYNSTDITTRVATTFFTKLVNSADYRLRGMPISEQVIIATQKLVDQYAAELRSAGNDASFLRIEGGYSAIMFDGRPIIPVPYFDTVIDLYQNNGTKWYRPHRAVYTTRTNLSLGFDSANPANQFKPGYDIASNSLIVRTGMSMDAKVIEDYMVQVGY